MKLLNFAAAVTALAGALSLSSCSEDFEVAAPYKDVTVVYGLLNVSDTAQYIRIQKTFMDENRSAVDLAKISDSSYYPDQDLDVRIKALSGNTVAFNDKLQRVNMADENLPKQPGIFFSSPGYAYKYTRLLNPSYTYRLVINNTRTGKIDSAETSVINANPNVGAGNFYVPAFSILSQKLDFANIPGTNQFVIEFGKPSNGVYFEGYIRIKYSSQVAGGPQTDSSFIWNFASIGPEAQRSLLTVNRGNFYSVLRDNVKIAPGNVVRFLDSADVYIWAANDPFFTYMQVNNAQGGITADQIQPNYTNFKGENVLGLFASRTVRIRFNIPFEQRTLDSIKSNNLTRDLNFAGFADH